MSEVLKLEMNGSGNTFTDSSASAHAITAVGNATQVPIKFTRTAYFFDGDSDYLTLPDSADWDLVGSAAQNYTIAFWVKHTDHVGTETYISQYEDANNYWVLEHVHGTGIQFRCNNGAGAVITTFDGAEITDIDWHHIALVKWNDSGTTKFGIYLDETQGGYVADNSTDTYAGVLNIGAFAPSNYFDGHMKNIRISNSNIFSAAPNVGLTDTITVPTDTPTADANTKLLLTGNPATGLSSPLCSTAWFDGNSDYLSVPDHADWDFAEDEDFTFECWYRPNAAASDNDFMGCDYRSGYMFTINATLIQMWASNAKRAESPYVFTQNIWYHVAWVRSGGDITIYVNGVATGAADTYSAALTCSAAMWIGRDDGYEKFLDGYIKELRLSDSARYTADFTPSTTPFTSDANTRLLLHLDGTPDDTDNTNGWLTDSTGTHTVSANGTAACKYIEDYRNRTVVDSSSSAHKGVMVGTAKLDWIAVEGAGAMSLDGTGDYLTIPDSPNWDFAENGSFTLSLWMKWRSVGYPNCLMGTAYTTGIYFGYTSHGMAFWADGSEREASVFTPLANQWYFLTCVRNVDQIILYVNGSQLDAGSTYGAAIEDTTEMWIGNNPAATQTPNGWMDVVLIDNGTATYTAPFIPPVYSDTPPTPTATRRIFLIT